MNAVVLSIGDELVSGQTVDTNSAYLSRELAARGIGTLYHCTIGDDRARITQAIWAAVRQAELVVITGGLGPTEDDLTRHALADVMGADLRLDERCLASLDAFFRRLGRTMAQANRVQAMIPVGAEALPNEVGTAWGIAADVDGSQIYIVPGVPYEMRWIFENVISPRLPVLEGAIRHHILHTFGMGESDVGEKIADLMQRGAEPTVGTTVAAGMVSIRVLARGRDAADADAKSQIIMTEIRRRLGGIVVGEDQATMPHVVGEMLRQRGQKLAVAESCTGGMIGEMITAVPGSSNYFVGGIIAYENRLKLEWLGVDEALLVQHGAVSEQVAAAMAQGCLERFGSDWALSVTGIAGPGGGTQEKPVGLVYLGIAGKNMPAIAHRLSLPGTREIVRLRSSLAAMNLLRLELQK